MTKTGDLCANDNCYGTGYVEFFGYCPLCWPGLSNRKREMLKADATGKELPPPITHVHKTEVHHPPVPWWLTLAIGFLGGAAAVGAAMAARLVW